MAFAQQARRVSDGYRNEMLDFFLFHQSILIIIEFYGLCGSRQDDPSFGSNGILSPAKDSGIFLNLYIRKWLMRWR